MEEWLKLAIEIQSLAQNGLTYSNNDFDTERYNRLRDISAEMIAMKSDVNFQKVKGLFCNESGYQTPKIDTRAAIFNDNKILLVCENNNKWALPGGWVDVLETIKSNTIKEVKEETGLDVVANRVIALQDRNKHNKPVYPYGVCKVFILCDYVGGSFVDNIETIKFDYFSLDSLPVDLAYEKTTKEQIEMCFKAYYDNSWKVYFD